MHGPTERARTDNIIALINVVFLMLIFFLFAGSVEPNDTNDITPPDVSVEREKTDTGGALVVLTDGTMRLGKTVISPEALVAAIRAEVQGNAEQPLRIVADKSLPATVLNEILARAREAGREKIILVARQARRTQAMALPSPRPTASAPMLRRRGRANETWPSSGGGSGRLARRPSGGCRAIQLRFRSDRAIGFARRRQCIRG
ncbi:biopolymer transporter ExbD [Breoghania sp.]|uniref:ExbD/TolR family protein n=1 Tax=Breoghania sp. TaxID=2065378 RepID=UPI0026020D11|nr:biopolymer transporter ExbD [Breoghania sp.]MDJ0932744.1 biopolymer transporter ExbD [Breoghania sp.]